MLKNERPISKTHYLTIDCSPESTRADTILKMVLMDNVPDFEEEDALLYNDSLSFDDFVLISANFGEWKFGIYKDKELLFELNLLKITDHLTNMYRSNLIRYAEWHPK